jgi:rare lipoprotein A (peptidoglycan hydrolase)
MTQRRLELFLTGLFLTSGAAAAYAESGTASVYSGGDTASGEQQNSGAHTAAHRTLPFGTMVQVTNTDNGRSITVRINDRGPFLRGRVLEKDEKAEGCLGRDPRRQGDDDLTVKLATSQSRRNSTLIIVC